MPALIAVLFMTEMSMGVEDTDFGYKSIRRIATAWTEQLAGNVGGYAVRWLRSRLVNEVEIVAGRINRFFELEGN